MFELVSYFYLCNINTVKNQFRKVEEELRDVLCSRVQQQENWQKLKSVQLLWTLLLIHFFMLEGAETAPQVTLHKAESSPTRGMVPRHQLAAERAHDDISVCLWPGQLRLCVL